MVGAALLAYIEVMSEKTFDDEDEEVYWNNDWPVLWSYFELEAAG